MYNLSDNYHFRKCYLEKEQVPTQSEMKKIMSPVLANVYFKSMNPQLKIVAGLEPPLTGGGKDWAMPPETLLAGHPVFKPLKPIFLNKLGQDGLIEIGEKLVIAHFRALNEFRREALIENDKIWQKSIQNKIGKQYRDEMSEKAMLRNRKLLLRAYKEFECLYKTSINNIESVMLDAAVAEIERIRQEAFQNMKEHYALLLKQQANMLYEQHEARLEKEKARLKAEFIEQLEANRTDTGTLLHDMNIEKHRTIEKIRQLLESQNLACQVYIALKEREEGKKEMEHTKHVHDKKVKAMKDEINLKNYEFRLLQEQELKCEKFDQNWKRKICHTIKMFKMFVDYCLRALPQYAEFFMNTEKLLMTHFSEAFEYPYQKSSIEFITPEPNLHPFYLFCDKGFKPHPNQNLGPERVTSSASQFPVIVINKNCIYSVCDNFEMFTDKVTQYLLGNRGVKSDFEDDHNYKFSRRVEYTPQIELQELQLESSLMQIIQKELPIRNIPSLECGVCKKVACFCTATSPSLPPGPVISESKSSSAAGKMMNSKKQLKEKDDEILRVMKPDNYFDYVASKKCKCIKTAKKHEYLPPYMTTKSPYEPLELPHYEQCSLYNLKELVKKAKGICSSPSVQQPPSNTAAKIDAATQYSDIQFEFLCTCFSQEEYDKSTTEESKLDAIMNLDNFSSYDHRRHMANISVSHRNMLHMSSSSSAKSGMSGISFVDDRESSLQNLLKITPELREIFESTDCKFN